MRNDREEPDEEHVRHRADERRGAKDGLGPAQARVRIAPLRLDAVPTTGTQDRLAVGGVAQRRNRPERDDAVAIVQHALCRGLLGFGFVSRTDIRRPAVDRDDAQLPLALGLLDAHAGDAEESGTAFGEPEERRFLLGLRRRRTPPRDAFVGRLERGKTQSVEARRIDRRSCIRRRRVRRGRDRRAVVAQTLLDFVTEHGVELTQRDANVFVDVAREQRNAKVEAVVL